MRRTIHEEFETRSCQPSESRPRTSVLRSRFSVLVLVLVTRDTRDGCGCYVKFLHFWLWQALVHEGLDEVAGRPCLGGP